MVKELLDGMIEFIVANPGSTRVAVRDQLVMLQPALRNRDAAGFIDAVALGLGELGYFDEPDATAITFGDLRGRLEVLGALNAKRALRVITNHIRGQAGVRTASLQIQRAPLKVIQDDLTLQRDDVVTHRDAAFPDGRPPSSDEVGRRVYDSINEIRKQIVEQRNVVMAKIATVDSQLAALGA